MIISGARVGFYHVAFPDYSFHRRPFGIMKDVMFHLILEIRIHERAKVEYARREVRRKKVWEADEKRKALAELKKGMEEHDNQTTNQLRRDKN